MSQTSIAVKLLCMGCQSAQLVMFYNDPSIEPKEYDTLFIPLWMTEAIEGKFAVCSECGAVNVAYVEWGLNPPELRTKVTEGVVYY